MQHFLNGVLMNDVDDLDPVNGKRKGLLGVQVHVGPPMKIEYRNIRLKRLKSTFESARPTDKDADIPVMTLDNASSLKHLLNQAKRIEASDPVPGVNLLKAFSIFDGKSLRGWEGNLEFFRVENDVIVAGTLQKPIPRNEFLCTVKEYQNFELYLRAKLVGDSVNAGIQFCSHRIPNSNEMIGYQADMSSPEPGFWGCL